MRRQILLSFFGILLFATPAVHAEGVLIFSDGRINKDIVQKNWVTAAITVGKITAQMLSKRKESGEIEEIKSYLSDLRISVDSIIEQNGEILSKIEEFPSVVEEELRKKELERSYRTLLAYRDAFYTWNQRRWTVGGAAGLIAAYRAIGDYETDPKRIVNLVEWGEFLQHLSRGSLRSVVLEVVTQRQETLDQLIANKQDKFAIAELMVSRSLNSSYLVNVNIVDRIEESTWNAAPNRSRRRTEVYSCNCYTPWSRCAADRVEVCDTCQRTLVEGDPGFDAERDTRVAEMNANVPLMKVLRAELVALRVLRNDLLDQYIKVLDYSSDEKELPSDMRIQFHKSVPFGEVGFEPLREGPC